MVLGGINYKQIIVIIDVSHVIEGKKQLLKSANAFWRDIRNSFWKGYEG